MKMKLNISTMSAALVLLAFTAASCGKWTEPAAQDFRREPLEETNPAEYERYLEEVRSYKASEHKVMFVTMDAPSAQPSRQNQHLMAMPDSADFICVNVGDGIHPSVAEEIAQVRSRKGTEPLLCIDYAPIHTAWGLLEDARSDAGQPAGTEEELVAFFREQTGLQLADCKRYGFSGLQVSFVGNRATRYAELSQDAYIKAVMDFHEANPELALVFRGSARNIADTGFLKECKYIVVIAGDEKKLSSLVTRLGDAPTDRIIMEVTVPSADNPVQVGRSAVEAAEWVVAESRNKNFTPCGIGVSNACDDYFNSMVDFYNIRRAMAVMNPAAASETADGKNN